jgi:hypothetical protein
MISVTRFHGMLQSQWLRCRHFRNFLVELSKDYFEAAALIPPVALSVSMHVLVNRDLSIVIMSYL